MNRTHVMYVSTILLSILVSYYTPILEINFIDNIFVLFQGTLNWKEVYPENDKPHLRYMFPIDDKIQNYKFAVSVNSFLRNGSFNQIVTKSIGMSWESCKVQSNNCKEIINVYCIQIRHVLIILNNQFILKFFFLVLGKIDLIEINVVSSKSIQMNWKLNCINSVLTLKGYRIEYCPISNKYSNDCAGKIFEYNS